LRSERLTEGGVEGRGVELEAVGNGVEDDEVLLQLVRRG